MPYLGKIKKNHLLVVLVVLVVGAVSFFGGMQYQRHLTLHYARGMIRRGFGNRRMPMRRPNMMPQPSASSSGSYRYIYQ